MFLSKKELRLNAKERLALISKQKYHLLGHKISKNILTLLKELEYTHEINFFSSSNVLGVFAPMKDEPWWPSAFKSFPGQLAFPKIGEKGKGLLFIKAKLSELDSSNEFGVDILSPKYLASRSEVVPEALLVPGLGFTKSGVRLGRGKGFYDCYLENYKGLRIGISFEDLIYEKIPSESHDEVLHYVVTESKIYKVNDEER